MTFNVAEMIQVAGRPMFAALQMLLSAERMFTLGEKELLPAILENSRKYQNNVSTQLAQQVTSALFEMLRGFQAADDHRNGELLREILAKKPQHVYHGLLTVLMRLVFVLYAEDRSLVSSDPVYTNHYSITGLFERLRSDAGRFPDTMDQRFGAWAQLLTLFRLVYDGGSHRDLSIPARKGYLFDPDRYPFLEGRYDDGDVGVDSPEEQESEIQVPRISDGVVYRMLEAVLILEGERLSYRALDVEQIGSVYEAVMGYQIEVATGKSIAIKPVKTHGAPSTINLEALLEAKPADRAKRLKEWSDQKL
ncbi:MAG: class I SAM-dependent DNA methyltransferase, partial [Fuerstiella sp.]|nr:class I SAM-dependent DNA methyltransferase [Fuerstiella sp.]